MRARILAAAIVATICAGETVAQQTALTDAEITQLVVGKSYDFGFGSGASYGPPPGNVYTFTSTRGGGNSTGKYTISGGKLCVKFDRGSSDRCDTFLKRGQEYYIVDSKGREYKLNSR